jgi:hypothetical protein
LSFSTFDKMMPPSATGREHVGKIVEAGGNARRIAHRLHRFRLPPRRHRAKPIDIGGADSGAKSVKNREYQCAKWRQTWNARSIGH